MTCPLLRQAIETHLKDTAFEDSKVPGWVNSICEDVMKGLIELEKPFKYMVTAVVSQNTGAGLHTSLSSFCDTVNDGEWRGRKLRACVRGVRFSLACACACVCVCVRKVCAW